MFEGAPIIFARFINDAQFQTTDIKVDFNVPGLLGGELVVNRYLDVDWQSGIFFAFLGSKREFDSAWGSFYPRWWFLGVDRKYAPF